MKNINHLTERHLIKMSEIPETRFTRANGVDIVRSRLLRSPAYSSA
jgi:hypothetical protein